MVLQNNASVKIVSINEADFKKKKLEQNPGVTIMISFQISRMLMAMASLFLMHWEIKKKINKKYKTYHIRVVLRKWAITLFWQVIWL